MYQRSHELLDAKIKEYLLPAIMMKLALQLGNVVDTMFVGNILGKDAMSVLGLALPVLSMVQIPALFLGNGGAIYAGILLGRRQKREANEVFTISFLITFVLNCIFFVSSFFIAKPLALLLSAGSSLKNDVASCVFIYLAFAPVFCIGVLFSRFFSADSHPKLASAYYIISNVLNLIFDYIFLKYTDMGVKGSAYSTVLGFSIGLVVAVFYVRSKKRMLCFVRLKPSKEELKTVFSTGTPHLTYSVIVMLKGFLLNRIILSLLKEDGIVVYTVCNNMGFILKMFIGGIMEVIPYTVSILYGERDYYGIRSVVKKVFGYAIPVTCILMTAMLVFTNMFSFLFGISEPSMQSVIVMVLRIYAFALPLQMLNYFGMQYYGSVEKTSLATVTSTLGNGSILIPAMYISIIFALKAHVSGYVGLATAFVVSEIMTVLVFLIYKKIKFPKESLLMISDRNNETCLDITIHSNVEEAVGVAEAIQRFCNENKVSPGQSNLIAVAAEEMAVNIASYGGNISQWIDICLTICTECTESEKRDESGQYAMTLRIRDNGVAFDPTSYEYDTSDIEYDIHGIELVRTIAGDITYVRAMDMNNTTITI